MISSLFDKNIIRIASFLIISPGSRYTRKEIKEKTQMNNVPLDKTLNKLLKLGILKEEKNLLAFNSAPPLELIGLTNYIKSEYKALNLPHDVFNALLESSGKLSEFNSVKEAYLFGSYAKLIYSDKSDIDLAIILSKKASNKIKIEKKIAKELKKIEKKAVKNIEPHFFSESDMKHKEDPLIKDILRNGKRLI